jgi:Carboxypeptidase regulatory-like domain/TonB dependent receptor-like, beta-barrel
MKKLAALVVAVLMLGGFSAYAQNATANLAGIVRDTEEKPLPGVTVLAKNAETGFERSDVTDENGLYRIASLPFGTYDITAQITGFATTTQKGIRLDVGRTLSVDFSMKLSATGEKVEVTGEAPLIERTESHIVTVVTPEQVENLPLTSRQFTQLGTLAPGTTATPHPDPTRGATDLAVGMNGGSGRNFNVTIDGGDNNDDTVGGVNEFYTLESIAEFNFLTQRYKAEYGRSSGGVLSVVTKTGTNTFHGGFFSLFRDTGLTAETQSEKDAVANAEANGTPVPEVPNPYDKQQYGGSFGGPVVKDRAFFFVAAERSQLDQGSLVDTQGADPAIDNTLVTAPSHTNLFTAKFNANINPQQYLTVRYGQQKTDFSYAALPNYAPTARGISTNKMKSVLASHSWVISENKLNEFAFQFANFHNVITPTSHDPSLQFSATYVFIGQNINVPQTTNQEKWEFKDDFSFTKSMKGLHHFKTGIAYVHEPTLNGTFSTTTFAPLYIFAGSDQSSPLVEIDLFGGARESNTPNNQTGFYFQDDWNWNEHLTLNLGIRYDVVTGLKINQSTSSLYNDLHAAPYAFSWLRPFHDSADGTISMDKNNFQPRLGAAYDLKGDGKTVIRGGWGLYYDFPYTNANLLFPLAALGDYGLIYTVANANGVQNPDGSPFQIGQPLPPNQLQPGARVENDVLSPDWKIPYTNQFSIGFGQQLSASSALDVDYVHVAVRDQYVRFKFNGFAPGTTTRILPNFGKGPRLYAPLGFADYDGVSFTYRQRMSNKLQFQGGYTFSKVEGNTLPGSDEFIIGAPAQCSHCALDFTQGPKDDPRMKGPLNTDARHRVVLAGIYDLPYEIRLSGFFRANSGKPFNGFVTADLNGDGMNYDTTDPHVNDHRGSSFSQLDMRVSKIFRIKNTVNIEGIFEVFNLFNATNPNGLNANIRGQQVVQNLDSTDPAFGTPLAFAGDPGQAEQRLAQFGFRISF